MTPPQNIRRVISPVADIRETPDTQALRGKKETQLVFGEAFAVETEGNGWYTGTCAHDGYKGHIEAACLGDAALAPATHIVTAVRSHIYRDSTIKSPILSSLGFGSLVTIAEEKENYALVEGMGWIFSRHLSAMDSKEDDYVETARKFLETPYVWGGRSGFGIDCSGLVQVCLARAGIKVPRDTEDQVRLGSEHDRPRHGDLVFFSDHVGIIVDADTVLHANAFHMKTVIEPLWMAEERSGGISAIRRI